MTQCPWCKANICSHEYEGELGRDAKMIEEAGECPQCGKFLNVEIDEETITTFTVHITGGRTKADRKYLAWARENQTDQQTSDKGEGK